MKSKKVTLTLVTLALIIFIGLGTASFASAAYFESTDVVGTDTVDEYPVGGNIYIKAKLAANIWYTINIVPDKLVWVDGEDIPDAVVTPINLKTDANGYFPTNPTLIWTGATYGEYDIIADRGTATTYGNGLYNLNDPSDNGDITIDAEVNTAGLIVTPEYVWGGLAALGVCFGAFVLIKRKNLPKISPLLK